MRMFGLNRGRRRAAAALAVAIVAVASTIAFVETRADATTASRWALDPANFVALNTPATALSGLPPAAHVEAGYDPAPGTVHQLGHGALAWVAAGRVCWSSDNEAGCAVSVPSEAQAIDPGVSDPDGIREGQPARLSGLAVNGVTQVTAVLKDGSRLSTAPVENWYEIMLPSSAAPWDVTRIEARLSSAATVAFVLPNVARPGQ